MACFKLNGLPPQPTRVWSRVQGRCSTEVVTENNPIVFFPPTGEFLPIGKAAEEYQMINKGNVLQYKKNSSNITMKARYSQIAKGQWVNRTKTFCQPECFAIFAKYKQFQEGKLQYDICR